ncbi:hypothetical protein KAR91_72050 [Candidatus Pacearchaeota archaeon]|nr:hypothetical protein [Candidatus Pacearchaeota archaeon]
MTYKLQITIHGSHPTETIATLGDLVYFIDDMAAMFSSTQFVDEEDIPLIITYQGEHNLDPITDRPLPSKLILSNAHSNIIAYEGLLPEFRVGDQVRHSFTGIPYAIKASAYYHINRAYNYLVFDPETDMAQLFPATQLLSEHLWNQIPTMLWNVTNERWIWVREQGMFVRETNKSRKMRPSDAINAWKMDFEKQEVPF